jgi:hypothetical protein
LHGGCCTQSGHALCPHVRQYIDNLQLTSIITFVDLYVQVLTSTLCALTVCRLATANRPSSQRLRHVATAGLSAVSVITNCMTSNTQLCSADTHTFVKLPAQACVTRACSSLHYCSCSSNARPATTCCCWKQTTTNYTTLACCHLHRSTVQSGSPVSVTSSFVSPLQAHANATSRQARTG